MNAMGTGGWIAASPTQTPVQIVALISVQDITTIRLFDRASMVVTYHPIKLKPAFLGADLARLAPTIMAEAGLEASLNFSSIRMAKAR
jgi:hypothetical protein